MYLQYQNVINDEVLSDFRILDSKGLYIHEKDILGKEKFPRGFQNNIGIAIL